MEFDFIITTPRHRHANRHTHSVIQQRATKVGAKTRRGKAPTTESKTKTRYVLIKNAELTASIKSGYEQQFGKNGVAFALRHAQPASIADTLASLDILSFQKDLRTKLLSSEAFYVPRKMCKVLQLTDHKFLRHIPSSYGHCPALDAAICSLMARVDDLPQILPESVDNFDNNLDIARRSSTSLLYNRALKLLQTAIDTGFETQITEVWYATLLLTLFELMSPSDEHNWVFHAQGAMHMLKTLGPERIVSEFQMSLLATQCPIMVIGKIVANKTCYLGEQPWQAVLQRSVLDESPFGERSQARVSLWCLNAQVPTVFHNVAVAIRARKQNYELREVVEWLIRDYEIWNETWLRTLNAAVEAPESSILDKDFISEMNIVFHAFSATIHRLRVAINPCGSLHHENQARDQSLNVLLRQDVKAIATGSTFAQGLFGLQIMTALMSTHIRWVEAIRTASAHVTIETRTFDEWTGMFGRTS